MSEIQRLRDDVLELDRQIRRLRAEQQQRGAGDFVRANAVVGVLPSPNVPAHGSIGLWTNQSGGALGIGAVVVQNGDRQFDTTTTVDDLDVVGVLTEAVSNTEEGRLRHQGYHPSVIVEGAVVAGQFLRTSTTAGAAEDAGTIPTEGVFGMALTAAAGPGAGTVAAYLFGTIGALTADSVYLPRVAGSTYDDVEDANTLFGSAGWFSGGVISDAGGGNIDVTAGDGVLRSAASATAQLLFIRWSASAGNAIPVGTTRYIGVEWNMGAPQVTVRATDNFNHFTDFELGIVVREPAADGGTLHPQQHEHHAGDAIHTVIERWHQTEHIRRDNELNGNILGESGDNNRNVQVSAGAYWVALDRFATSAFDSSGADTFDTYSAGGLEAAGVSVWPNAQYDNGGVLAGLGGNKWANLWWYQELNGSIVMIYGTAQYNTEAMAGEEALPSTVPDRVSVHGTPIGRYIFQNGDTIPSQIQTIFIDIFNIAGVTDHGGLDGLLDDDHTIYLLADGTRALNGDINLDGNNIDNGGVIFLKEQAEADADVPGSGQIWVDTQTPNVLFFTDDAGNDFRISEPDESVRAYHDAAQTIADSTVTVLAFNQERWDTNGLHDLAVNNSRLTAQVAGTYVITMNCQFDVDADGFRQVHILLNGTTIIAVMRFLPPAAATTIPALTTTYQLAVTDYVEAVVYHEAGGNLDILSAAQYSPEFGMVLVR